MDPNSSRPIQSGPSSSQAPVVSDWKDSFTPERRQAIVDEIFDIIRSVSADDLVGARAKAEVFEQSVYNNATDESSYIRKVQELSLVKKSDPFLDYRMPMPAGGDQNLQWFKDLYSKLYWSAFSALSINDIFEKITVEKESFQLRLWKKYCRIPRERPNETIDVYQKFQSWKEQFFERLQCIYRLLDAYVIQAENGLPRMCLSLEMIRKLKRTVGNILHMLLLSKDGICMLLHHELLDELNVTEASIQALTSRCGEFSAAFGPRFSATIDSHQHMELLREDAGWRDEIYEKIKKLDEAYYTEIESMVVWINDLFYKGEMIMTAEEREKFYVEGMHYMQLMKLDKQSVQVELGEVLSSYEGSIADYMQQVRNYMS